MKPRWTKQEVDFLRDNIHSLTLEQISDVVGESAPTIGYRIKAYKLMVKHGVIDKKKYPFYN